MQSYVFNLSFSVSVFGADLICSADILLPFVADYISYIIFYLYVGDKMLGY